MLSKAMDDYSSRLKLIEHLYQVAVDPLSFRELLNEWDKTILESLKRNDGRLGDVALSDHAVRANTILEMISKEEAAQSEIQFADAIQLDPNPAILISVSGRCVAINPIATRLFDVAEGGDVVEALIALGSPPGKLGNLIDKLATTPAQQGGVLGLVELSEVSGEKSTLLALSRVPATGNDAAAGMLTVLAPVWSHQTINAVREHFHFTEAEISIVQALANGLNADQIADERQTSILTVRSQIKAILSKANLGTQTNLVRYMGFLQRYENAPQHYANNAAGGGGAAGFTSDFFTLSTGRRMAYRELGPADGRPVLYIHGMIDSTRLPLQTIDALHKRNIRLIAPTRPAYGQSEPYQTPDNALAEFADYAIELLDFLKIDRVPVFGHMAGTLYGVALAGHHPTRVSSIFSLAGAVPMVAHSQFSGMSTGHRISGLTARHAPALLPVLIKGGIRLIRSGKEEQMFDLAFEDGSRDKAVAEEPEIRELLYERYRFVTVQGENAFKTDIMLASSDWSALMDKLECSMSIVHGAHDKVVLVDGVRGFADKHPNCQLTVLEDAGQLVLLTDPQIVLDHLERQL